jgi:2-aminoadipate transaminase
LQGPSQYGSLDLHIGMDFSFHLEPDSGVPLYRQIHARLRDLIAAGALRKGERLPPTRELAVKLGLNRSTIASAYALLESDGLIRGHVGRGSFILGAPDSAPADLDWDRLLAPSGSAAPPPVAGPEAISFATSRPSEDLFPMDDFRRSAEEVLASPHAAAILQLGSPAGYGPLRYFLLEEARREGVERPGDDVLITNGCQQALDLLARVLVRPGDAVAIEDPVYPGLRNLFQRAGARLAGVAVGPEGIEPAALERVLAETRPRVVVVTSDFQNPTGATLPPEARAAVLAMTRAAGAVLVENDIYAGLRYAGAPSVPMKRLDDSGHTVLIGSFSKITFPGLRVGWILGPKPLIARLTEAKQLADLHTDQLAQALLLRFAESGRLAAHHGRIVAAGAERLRAVIEACERHLPRGTVFTRPEGGMSLWVRLPEPLDAGDLLARAEREGVAYLPGKYFEVSRRDPGALRLSFADLPPERIRAGVAILGRVFSSELARTRLERYDGAPAIV